jgi:hypothetical protein
MTFESKLVWPSDWSRTTTPRASKYRVTLADAVADLYSALSKHDARYVRITTNRPLSTATQLPLAHPAEPQDAGVAVYWHHRFGTPRVIACDTWLTVRENIRAITYALDGLRMIERAEASQILSRAYAGFTLPSVAVKPVKSWREILGFTMKVATPGELKKARKELLAKHHPDRGGDAEMFHAVEMAYAEAMKEVA